jgi:hypothetical protein
VFFDVIPVKEHFQPLFRLPPAIAPPLATMTSLFVLLITYGTRDAVATPPRRRPRTPIRDALLAAGALVVAMYLFGNVLVGSHLYGDTGHTTIGSDSKLVAGDLAFVLLYCAFFALLTRAFLLLAMVEYFRKRT